jgi:hypothetical protein
MAGRLSHMRKRLAILEKAAAEIAEEKRLADCNCRRSDQMVFYDQESFKSAMETPCPVHGFRNLGYIKFVFFVNPDGSCDQDTPELRRLQEIYTQRLTESQSAERNRSKGLRAKSGRSNH